MIRDTANFNRTAEQSGDQIIDNIDNGNYLDQSLITIFYILFSVSYKGMSSYVVKQAFRPEHCETDGLIRFERQDNDEPGL